MRILITGSDGFIGRHLSNHLQGNPLYEIFDYDLATNDDLRDRANLDRMIEMVRPEVIIHLGALAGVRRGEDYPKEYFETNVWGTENVFSLAKKHGVSKVISFSSSSVFNDKGELQPQSHYGKTKLLGEKIAEMYKKDIPNIYIVRPFTVYGLYGRGDQVIYKWINQIKGEGKITFFGDGNSYRPYTHVKDLCVALNSMLMRNIGFQTFNIGGKDKVYLKELLDIFKKNIDTEFNVEYLPLPKADSMGREPNTENWDLIDYEPVKDFKEEVIKIIKENI